MLFNFCQLFNKNNSFDMLMLEVFNAHNDLTNSANLLLKNENDSMTFRFVFKMHIAIIKECCSLLYNGIFKSENVLKSMDNYERIKALKQTLDKNNEINIKVLSKVRNHAYHYTDSKEYINILSDIDFKDFETSIKPDDSTKLLYSDFVDKLYFDILLKYYRQYKQMTLESDKDIYVMAKELAEFGVNILNLFNEIIVGFIKLRFNNNAN